MLQQLESEKLSNSVKFMQRTSYKVTVSESDELDAYLRNEILGRGLCVSAATLWVRRQYGTAVAGVCGRIVKFIRNLTDLKLTFVQ